MSRPPIYKFRLFVAGDAQNSTLAAANLTELCKTYLPGRHAIELVNVFAEPKRALAEGILMTPTLIKLSPTPAPKRIVGTLGQTEPLLQALGLPAAAK